MNDNIRHPAHYTDGEIEVIDYIRDKLTPEQFVGYCIGNVMKYISRYRLKGAPAQDLRKAQVYLEWAADAQEGAARGASTGQGTADAAGGGWRIRR